MRRKNVESIRERRD